MLDHLASPCLADWGFRVTLCAAILSDSFSKITTITDLKVGLGSFAADFGSLKSTRFYRDWAVMYAGEDVESVPFILDYARTIVMASKKPPTPHDLARAIDQAYARRVQEIVETKVLRRFGYTSDSFRRMGKKQLTASVYNLLCSRIADIKLRIKFLITGFDEHKKGHILVAGNDEPPVDYTSLGFFAIGSGAPAALSSLLFHKSRARISSQMPDGLALYFLCEAKFMAESGDVGEATFVMILDSQSEPKCVTDPDAIRKIWEEEGAPRVPHGAALRLRRFIREGKDIQKAVEAKTQKQREREAKIDELDPDVAEITRLIVKLERDGKIKRKEKDGTLEFVMPSDSRKSKGQP